MSLSVVLVDTYFLGAAMNHTMVAFLHASFLAVSGYVPLSTSTCRRRIVAHMREEVFSLGADTASSFLTLGTLYLHMETTVALLKHFVAWVFDVSPAGSVQCTLTVA